MGRVATCIGVIASPASLAASSRAGGIGELNNYTPIIAREPVINHCISSSSCGLVFIKIHKTYRTVILILAESGSDEPAEVLERSNEVRLVQVAREVPNKEGGAGNI